MWDAEIGGEQGAMERGGDLRSDPVDQILVKYWSNKSGWSRGEALSDTCAGENIELAARMMNPTLSIKYWSNTGQYWSNFELATRMMNSSNTRQMLVKYSSNAGQILVKLATPRGIFWPRYFGRCLAREGNPTPTRPFTPDLHLIYT